MPLLTRMLKQTAVYWAPLTNPDGSELHDEEGLRRYDAPVQIKCRWEGKKREAIDSTGSKTITNATIYVDRDVSVGGKLRYGLLADVPFPEDPKENDSVYEIVTFDKTPDLRAKRFLRTVTV